MTVVRLFPEGRISTGNEARRRRNYFELRMRMIDWFLRDSGSDLTASQRQRALNALFNAARWLDPLDPDVAERGFLTLDEHGYMPSVDLFIPNWFVLLARITGARRAGRFRKTLTTFLAHS